MSDSPLLTAIVCVMTRKLPAKAGRSLDMALARSSRRFVDRAFACHEESDWEGFIVHAGIAIELLAKAVLAKLNPLLIADTRNEKSLVTLARSGAHDTIPSSVRTIDAETALRRAREIGVPLNRFENDIRALREARNQIVHSGNHDQDVVERGFDGWIRSMVALCEHAGYKMYLVFGANSHLIEIQMKEYASSLEALWKLRRTAAEARWQYEISIATTTEIERRSALLQAELESANAIDPTVQWAPCAVCGLPAYLSGEFEPEPDFDVEGDEVFVTGFYYEFIPTSLHCQTCGLNLDSRGLVEQSAVLECWEFDQVDGDRWARLDQAHWDHEWR